MEEAAAYYRVALAIRPKNSAVYNNLGVVLQAQGDLDEAIARMSEDPSVDQLRLTRLKKRKLKLKDWISHLESQLIPDLDA